MHLPGRRRRTAPHPAISLWHSSGCADHMAGALAFSFTWVFQRDAATEGEPLGAVHEGDRPADPAGDLRSRAVRSRRSWSRRRPR